MKKRKLLPIFAGILALAILLTGTLAYTNFAQSAQNIFRGFSYDVILHDYFNWRGSDIYSFSSDTDNLAAKGRAGGNDETHLIDPANAVQKELLTDTLGQGVEKHVFVENPIARSDELSTNDKELYLRVKLDIWQNDTGSVKPGAATTISSLDDFQMVDDIANAGITTGWVLVGSDVADIATFTTAQAKWFYDADDGYFYWGEPLKGHHSVTGDTFAIDRDNASVTKDLISAVYFVEDTGVVDLPSEYYFEIGINLQAVTANNLSILTVAKYNDGINSFDGGGTISNTAKALFEEIYINDSLYGTISDKSGKIEVADLWNLPTGFFPGELP